LLTKESNDYQCHLFYRHQLCRWIILNVGWTTLHNSRGFEMEIVQRPRESFGFNDPDTLNKYMN
jgi:hypothetical protein